MPFKIIIFVAIKLILPRFAIARRLGISLSHQTAVLVNP